MRRKEEHTFLGLLIKSWQDSHFGFFRVKNNGTFYLLTRFLQKNLLLRLNLAVLVQNAIFDAIQMRYEVKDLLLFWITPKITFLKAIHFQITKFHPNANHRIETLSKLIIGPKQAQNLKLASADSMGYVKIHLWNQKASIS